MGSDRKNILYLLGISVLLLALLTGTLQLLHNYYRPEYILPDAISYRGGANFLYRHGFSANSIRPFGYPLVIGLPMLFGNVSDLTILRFAIILNIICWLLTVVVLYKIITLLSTRKVAFIGTLIFVGCISHAAGVYQSLSESFFLLVTLSSFYYLLRYVQRRQHTDALLFIGLLCFSVTIRPISLYFALLAAFAGIGLFLYRRQWRNAVITLVLLLSTIGLQSVMMHRKFGSYTLSFIQNYTLYTYLMCTAEYLQQGKPMPFGDFYQHRMTATDSILSIYPYESPQYLQNADAYYKANVKVNLAGNKAYVAKAMFLNMVSNCRDGSPLIAAAKNYTGSSSFVPVQKFLVRITIWQNILLSVAFIFTLPFVAFLLFFRRKQHSATLPFIVPMCLFAAYLFTTSCVSYWQGDRFTFILYPFTIITTAYLLATRRSHDVV